MKAKNQNWYEKGINNIWLPYTQMQNLPEQLKVKKTKGSNIYLDDGRKMIDGVSAWWSTAHGHNHPHITKAIRRQTKKFPHIMLAGFAHQPAYELASKLIEFVNRKTDNLSKVFFSDSGSTAVEVALKMSLQYHYNKKSKKTKFIAFENSYHGDTFGAMSLATHSSSMHEKFKDFMPNQITTTIPNTEREKSRFIELLDHNINDIAGLIIEPLIQCAGGMKFHSIDTLEFIIRECKKRQIITIFDECATGFYRTGKKFAFHNIAHTPDILILGKALTGGTITLSATITNDKIYNSFLSDSLDNALMHGPTFMANPTACAAAIASIELFEKIDYENNISNITEMFSEHLEHTNKKIKEIRILGAVAVIELNDCNWQLITNLREIIKDSNFWLRPFSNVIYLMPPLNIKNKDLIKLIDFSNKLIDRI